MAKLLKYLQSKHKGLCLIPRTQVKAIPVVHIYDPNPASERVQEDRGTSGL